jgi:hypothetical protein
MFAVENAWLRWMAEADVTPFRAARGEPIGAHYIKSDLPARPSITSVTQFFERLHTLKRSPRAKYDDSTYYIPYLMRYFADLELAFSNLSRGLVKPYEGYIIVRNNTHRGIVIPVAEAILDIWRGLGCAVDINAAEERFHIGAKNPRAKGIRAKHIEYTLHVSMT